MTVARVAYTTSERKCLYRRADNEVALVSFSHINPFDESQGGGFLTGCEVEYCSANRKPYTKLQEAIMNILGLVNYLLFLLIIVIGAFSIILLIKFQILSMLFGLLGLVVIVIISAFIQTGEAALFLHIFPNKNGWYLLHDEDELKQNEIEKLNVYFNTQKRVKSIEEDPYDSKN